MINPDYSLKILDVLLKTKPDDNAIADEVGYNEALNLPILKDNGGESVILFETYEEMENFQDISDEFDEDNPTVKKITLDGSPSDSYFAAEEAANTYLYDLIEGLTDRNGYNPDVTKTKKEIVIPFIDFSQEDEPISAKKLFKPLGYRVPYFTFDGNKPTSTGTKNNYSIDIDIYTQLASGGSIKNNLKSLIEDKLKEFEGALKSVLCYSSSAKDPYYTTWNDLTGPQDEEKLIITINQITFEAITTTINVTAKYRTNVGTGQVTKQGKIKWYKKNITSVDFEISSGVYSQNFGANEKGMNYPKHAFIGLFTTMPNIYGLDAIEPSAEEYENGDAKQSYKRVSLHEDLLYGNMSLNDVRQIDAKKYPNDATEHKDYQGCAFIDNKELIIFPEVLNDDGWGAIEGFGVFEDEDQGSGKKPYFWGELTNQGDDDANASYGQVPLFRKNEFKIYLG